MINIFYNPVYIKSKKVFITKQLKHSKLVNLFIDLNYFLNTPIHENLIQSGPHKRMNNLIKTFKKDNEINFNSIKFSNNYVIQYDDYGKNIVNKIINSKDPNKKIIIGPLYNIDQDLEINTLIKKHNYIKKLVASEVAYKNAFEMDSDINLDNVMICPSGIIFEHDVVNNIEISKREDKCLIF